MKRTLLILALFVLLPFTTLHSQQTTLTFVVGDCKFEMVYIESGTFVMGNGGYLSNQYGSTTGFNADTSFIDELPAHTIQLYDYYLGRYEVTQQLWTAVMGYNPSNFKGENLPVEQVSYFEVQEFIKKLNDITGMNFRLPTEAEWEYAARGGRKSQGTPYAGSNNPQAVGWGKANSGSETHPVGSLSPNELNIYDLNGNVWEWCNDWYFDLYYVQLAAESQGVNTTHMTPEALYHWFTSEDRTWIYFNHEILNPLGPDTGSYKVGRGGSWADEPRGFRLPYRNFWVPTAKISNVGFRLALNATEKVSNGWMPNQYIIDSVADGKVYLSHTTQSLYRRSIGELDGLFSVAPDKQIRFSKGNLQYNPAARTYRFADEQYNTIGLDNTNSKESYSGWIDLFGWATSGHRGKTPTYFAANSDYYGNGKRNIDGTPYDWGVNNAISNGGDTKGQWRTPTVNELTYLFTRRSNAQHLMALATIENTNGILILPDDWLERGLDTLKSYLSYHFTLQEWKLIERAGAVFLPAAGYCSGGKYTINSSMTINSAAHQDFIDPTYHIPLFSLSDNILDPAPNHLPASVGGGNADLPDIPTPSEMEFWFKVNPPKDIALNDMIGYYWTSIHFDKTSAMAYCFKSRFGGFIRPLSRNTRAAVRLIKDVEK